MDAPAGARSAETAMAREIRDQPGAVARTIGGLVPVLGELTRLVRGCHQVICFGRGTSEHAAYYASLLLSSYAGVPAFVGRPSLATVYRAPLDLRGSVVVAVSQSGATDEICEVVAWAARAGARTLAVTNEATSPLAAAADLALVTLAGAEQAVPATKTFTTALVALSRIAFALRPPEPALDRTWHRLPESLEGVLAALTGGSATGILASATEALPDAWPLVVAGRGYSDPAARETALKLTESTGQLAYGASQADLEHGPLTVVRAGAALIVVAADNSPTGPGLLALARTARERGATLVGIGGGAALRESCAYHLAVPVVAEELSPILLSVPGQLLAEAFARRLGKNPDLPAGLTKVTQTH